MKIERILCGMQTIDGKIFTKYSPGAKDALQPKSRERIKQLRPEDSFKALWFPTEQTLSYSIVILVVDKDPEHGGRDWYQNQTFLVNIHEFIACVQTGKNPFELFKANAFGELETFPETLTALTV